MSQGKSIERVAVIGAKGHVGNAFVQELAKTGKHTVTCLTRKSGGADMSDLPAGVRVVGVDYDDEASLAAALEGQQFLAITMSTRAPADLHGRIVAAAGKARVPFIMPNAYGYDPTNERLAADDGHVSSTRDKCAMIAAMPHSAYIVMACGFWYEWSLAYGPSHYGFDIAKREVTLFDDGQQRINTSTWLQCGRALAALLSLPESELAAKWRNRVLYVSSFRASQRDMLDSFNRVLGTTDADWRIARQPAAERHQYGKDQVAAGVDIGRAYRMYARIFYANGDGDFEARHGTANADLGLPSESIDDATRRAVDMVESGWKPRP